MQEQDLIGLDWAKQVLRGEFKANKYVTLECARYVKRMEGGKVENKKMEYITILILRKLRIYMIGYH